MAYRKTSVQREFLFLSPGIVAASFFLPILFVPILVYRWLLIKCANCWRPDLAHILRSSGSLFLHDSVHVEPNVNIVVSFYLDGIPDFEEFKRFCFDRIVSKKVEHGHELEYPELQQYCAKWGGYFFWKQEAVFDINEHVRFHRPEPDDDIDSFCTRYMKEPLPESRSPWQFLVVGGTEQSSGRHSHHILFKFHHSLSDAYGIMQIMRHFPDADPPAVYLDPSKYNEKYSGCLSTPFNWLTVPIRAGLQMARLYTKRITLPPWPQLPPEPMAGGRRKQHIYGGVEQVMEFESVKQIAKRYSVCVTSVLFGAMTGALREHLFSKYSPESIPSHISFPQIVPVPRRSSGLCNTLSMVTFKLPIGEPNPVARIRACDEMIRGRKRSVESLVTFLVLQVRGLLPSWFPFLRQFDSRWACMSTTIVPGPLSPCTFRGQPVLGMKFNFVASPFTFYVSMMSYNGNIQWSCNGDTRVFTEYELKRIGEAIGEEFQALEKIPPEPAKSSINTSSSNV